MNKTIPVSISTNLLSSITFNIETPVILNSETAGAVVKSIVEHNSVPNIELLSCYRWDFNCTNDSIIRQMIIASRKAEVECRSEGSTGDFEAVNREAIATVLEANSCNYSSRDTYYRDELLDCVDISNFSESIREALEDADAELLEDSPSFDEEEFEDALLEQLTLEVEKADKSSISCLFSGRRYSAEIVYTPSFNWGSESSEDTDLFVHLDSDGGFTTEGVEELMQMANVGRSELEQYIRESGLNLYDGARESLDKISFEADPEKQKIQTPKLVWITLENAPRGGIPTFTTYVDACEFLNRDITKDMTFKNGVLGLEDTIWGSGHNESTCNPFTIPCGNTNWHMLSDRNLRDGVYGYHIGSLKSDVEQK